MMGTDCCTSPYFSKLVPVLCLTPVSVTCKRLLNSAHVEESLSAGGTWSVKSQYRSLGDGFALWGYRRY